MGGLVSSRCVCGGWVGLSVVGVSACGGWVGLSVVGVSVVGGWACQ